MSWFAYLVPSGVVTKHDVSQFGNMCAAEVAAALNLAEGERLFVHTPLYQQALKPDDHPLEKFEGLTSTEVFDPFKRPDFYLFARPAEKAHVVSILVRVANHSHHMIPSFYADFDVVEFRGKHGADVSRHIVRSLALDVDHSTVLVNGRNLSAHGDARKILAQAKVSGFELVVDVTKAQEESMKQRTCVLKEIIDTEKSYIASLDILTSHWADAVKKTEMMSPDEFKMVFGDLATIKKVHQMILDALQDTGEQYGSEIAYIFLSKLEYLKCAKQYITNYRNVDAIVRKYQGAHKWKEIVCHMPEHITKGKDFRSYLIMPVQRIPRYPLLLGQLKKLTPPSHPDFEYLSLAEEGLEGLLNTMDESSGIGQEHGKLQRLQTRIGSTYDVLVPTRDLRHQFEVELNRNRREVGRLYLCNDLILLTHVIGRDEEEVIFDCNVDLFNFSFSCFGSSSLLVEANGRKYCQKRTITSVFAFKTKDDQALFFGELSKLQSVKCLKSDEATVTWKVPDMKGLSLCLVKPKCVAVDDGLYVFSTSKGQCNVYVIRDGVISLHQQLKGPHAFRDVTVCRADDFVYLWSSETLYKYDIRRMKINSLDLDMAIERRAGPSLAFVGGRLVLFGGKRGHRRYSDETYVINPATGHVDQLIIEQDKPSPRWNHAAIAVGNEMVICGGSDGALKDDVFILNPERRIWRQMLNISIGARKHHSMLALPSQLLGIVGGVGESNVRIIDYATYTERSVVEFGLGENSHYGSAVMSSAGPCLVTGLKHHDRLGVSSVRTLDFRGLSVKVPVFGPPLAANETTKSHPQFRGGLLKRKCRHRVRTQDRKKKQADPATPERRNSSITHCKKLDMVWPSSSDDESDCDNDKSPLMDSDPSTETSTTSQEKEPEVAPRSANLKKSMSENSCLKLRNLATVEPSKICPDVVRNRHGSEPSMNDAVNSRVECTGESRGGKQIPESNHRAIVTAKSTAIPGTKKGPPGAQWIVCSDEVADLLAEFDPSQGNDCSDSYRMFSNSECDLSFSGIMFPSQSETGISEDDSATFISDGTIDVIRRKPPEAPRH